MVKLRGRIVSELGGAHQVSVQCCVLSEGVVWCAVWRRQVFSPVMCACVCTASTSFSQLSGSFRPASSSAPVVSGGAVAAERSPPICEGELCGVSSPSVWLRRNTIL